MEREKRGREVGGRGAYPAHRNSNKNLRTSVIYSFISVLLSFFCTQSSSLHLLLPPLSPLLTGIVCAALDGLHGELGNGNLPIGEADGHGAADQVHPRPLLNVLLKLY